MYQASILVIWLWHACDDGGQNNTLPMFRVCTKSLGRLLATMSYDRCAGQPGAQCENQLGFRAIVELFWQQHDLPANLHTTRLVSQ